MHFTHDAALVETVDGRYQVTFKGVTYKSTRNTYAIGTLLFGLRPKGLDFDFKSARPENVILFIEQAAQALHLHANRHSPLLRDFAAAMGKELLERRIAEAVALAPDETAAAEAKRLIIENLGPAPFDEAR